jgi:hypothetical protein
VVNHNPSDIGSVGLIGRIKALSAATKWVASIATGGVSLFLAFYQHACVIGGPQPFGRSWCSQQPAPEPPVKDPVAAVRGGSITFTLTPDGTARLEAPLRTALESELGGLANDPVRQVVLAVGKEQTSGAGAIVGIAWRLAGTAANVQCQDQFRYFSAPEFAQQAARRVRQSIEMSQKQGSLTCG